MSQQVEIQADGYSLVLTARGLETFQAAIRSDRVKGKTGEALDEALLAVAAGGISTVERRRKDGKLNDGPNGEPARQVFNESGGLVRAERYKDGKRNDGPEGEPAVQVFNESGRLVRALRHKDGRENDGANGEPAVEEFYGSGALARAVRWMYGRLNDGANGQPAYLEFNESGGLAQAVRWEDGQFVHMLDAAEMAAYQEAAEREQTIHSIEVALPALKFL